MQAQVLITDRLYLFANAFFKVNQDDFISSKLELNYEQDEGNSLNLVSNYSGALWNWIVKLLNILVMMFKINKLEEKSKNLVELISSKMVDMKVDEVKVGKKNRPKSEIKEGSFKFGLENLRDLFPEDSKKVKLNSNRGAERMYRGYCLD